MLNIFASISARNKAIASQVTPKSEKNSKRFFILALKINCGAGT